MFDMKLGVGRLIPTDRVSEFTVREIYKLCVETAVVWLLTD